MTVREGATWAEISRDVRKIRMLAKRVRAVVPMLSVAMMRHDVANAATALEMAASGYSR